MTPRSMNTMNRGLWVALREHFRFKMAASVKKGSDECTRLESYLETWRRAYCSGFFVSKPFGQSGSIIGF